MTAPNLILIQTEVFNGQSPLFYTFIGVTSITGVRTGTFVMSFWMLFTNKVLHHNSL